MAEHVTGVGSFVKNQILFQGRKMSEIDLIVNLVYNKKIARIKVDAIRKQEISSFLCFLASHYLNLNYSFMILNFTLMR